MLRGGPRPAPAAGLEHKGLHRAGPGSVPNRAVDPLSEQVGRAVVAGVRLDHVHQDPARGHVRAGLLVGSSVEVQPGQDPITSSALRLPEANGLPAIRRRGVLEVEVGLDFRAKEVVQLEAAEGDADPAQLHIGHVPNQA